MKRNRFATTLVLLGVVMVIGAFALVGYNIYTDKQAESSSNTALQILIEDIPKDEEQKPEYIDSPYIEMPKVEIEDTDYIGYIEIPRLGLSLPVINTSNQINLNRAPCRFFGSAYLDNMVIGAHNYGSHFGYIGSLGFGDEVIFTDINGNVFNYKVADIEILKPHQAEYLCNGEWPLSLYTCTISGLERVTVRCEKI